jgi:hypothetical protein
VTKSVGLAEITAALAAGLTDLGESRVQEAREKSAALQSPSGVRPRWELVGHLQRNKVRAALDLFALLHAVDSLRLVAALAQEAERGARSVELLLEVNVSGEATKYGLRAEEVAEVLAAATRAPGLRVRGLMTMAPLVANPEEARGVFRALRELKDELNRRGAYPEPLTELSMGMTNDFEVAVEEGATVVRLGTALFG